MATIGEERIPRVVQYLASLCLSLEPYLREGSKVNLTLYQLVLTLPLYPFPGKGLGQSGGNP